MKKQWILLLGLAVVGLAYYLGDFKVRVVKGAQTFPEAQFVVMTGSDSLHVMSDGQSRIDLGWNLFSRPAWVDICMENEEGDFINVTSKVPRFGSWELDLYACDFEQLLMLAEKQFKVPIAKKEADFKTVGDLIDYISRAGGEKEGEVLQELQALLTKVLKVPPENILLSTRFTEDLGLE